jgi:cytochrome c
MRYLTAALAAICLTACSEQKTEADAGDPVIADGRGIAEEQCSQCHATGAGGASPNPKAPVFRILLNRYAEDALANDLAEGIRIGHPDMPQITLRPEGVDALIAYLKSIQEKPAG